MQVFGSFGLRPTFSKAHIASGFFFAQERAERIKVEPHVENAQHIPRSRVVCYFQRNPHIIKYTDAQRAVYGKTVPVFIGIQTPERMAVRAAQFKLQPRLVVVLITNHPVEARLKTKKAAAQVSFGFG